ncbi:PKD domain-containing protein [Fluviicola taffensis]|uniref:PKD domain containing protein n=1 Tax=Fluviicola taffensis (strain DSM 16823 / NCIMB 13979 / RW262) TaxID=755732 RepID=F2IK95_FLUTR|nr:PKD domain-containing protein [Fluviicola taffensis]AEA43998.1 PKD domain containing protein [Fluviicola taffensis DSM 16823]
MFYRVAFLVICLYSVAFGQTGNILLHPNEGQWDSKIHYSVDINRGTIFLNQTGFTYFFNDAMTHHHENHIDEDTSELKIHCQVIKSALLNTTWKGVQTKGSPSEAYRNYYQGNDPSRWKSKVYSTNQVLYRNIYDGIDLKVEGKSDYLKYSYIVAPGANVQNIVTEITGSKRVFLREGDLVTETEFGEIIEKSPIAWSLQNGKKVKVAVSFSLKDNRVSYQFPKGFSETDTLIIDPDIVFSTFTGSTMDNWGMTATPDQAGNLYGGGIVFAGSGTYPTITGSFDLSFNGGNSYSAGGGSIPGFDVAISKFNATGTNLIYSTFLGGSGNESVHSLVTDEQGHLYAMGVTSSPNFPTIAGCIDETFNGGPTIVTNGLGFLGADIYVCHFDANGSALIGSTYLGGGGPDGINGGSLFFNYGDAFRGEIVVKSGEVYITSSTSSDDFPLASPFQSTLIGSQDAVVVKMNNGLTSLIWSTYIGGLGADSGNGIQLSSTGDVYVSGGTSSSNMPFSTGNDLSYNGGISDAYLIRLSGTTGTVLSGTYSGTNEYDQAFFVQLDLNDNVYIYAQSEGSIPISPGKYGIGNSGQYIAKYSPNLVNLLWTTPIGSGSGHIEISPTAFLVSNCGEIYLAGWGGQTNVGNSPGAIHSTTTGLPVTSDAYQSTTTGSNFWIAVLEEDAVALNYATFIGGTTGSSSNHVDGGTSRFDKNGNIYHAVCAACGSVNNGFSTTPGVWSPTNPSPNCNLAAFKFELSTIEAIVAAPDPLICLPDPVIFNNNSANGNEFDWDFGDGTGSSLVNPSHVYAGPGQYTVTLIVTDTTQCFTPDTVQFIVNIGDFNGGIVNPLAETCANVPFQMEAFGGSVYHWEPAALFNNPNISNPLVSSPQSVQIYCVISDSCGIDTVYAQVNILNGALSISNDTAICIGNSVNLFVNGVTQIVWSPATYLDNPSSFTPVSTPLASITYSVTGTTVDGCQLTGNVHIHVDTTLPNPVMPDSLLYCLGGSGVVNVSGATSYNWSPSTNINPVNGPQVTISTPNDQYYYCLFTNACGTAQDSIYVKIHIPSILAGNDTTICPGETAILHASGGVSYTWNPSIYGALQSNGSLVIVKPTQTGTVYVATGVDQHGCIDTASVRVNLFPIPFVQTNPDVYAVMGEIVQLNAISNTAVSYVWSPAEYLSCNVCQNPVTQPDKPMVYTVVAVDINGCKASDIVRIYYDAIIYVPNTFTPNNNGTNERFFALGINIRDFKLEIFNRWGELIYSGDALSQMWDGNYVGLPCPDGVYTWKIEYGEVISDLRHQLVGHVNLLR